MLATLRERLRLLPSSSGPNYLLLPPLRWVAAIARHLAWQSQKAPILQVTGMPACSTSHGAL